MSLSALAPSPPTSPSPSPSPAAIGPPAVPAVPEVLRRLEALLAAERERWGARDPRFDELVTALAGYVLDGGKRLRPSFCLLGHEGAGGDPEAPAAVDAAAGLELLHAFALLHDDVMDGSETRRGRPAMHRRLADEHAAAGHRGEGRRFGEGLAVLIGDLAFAYADRLLSGASPAVRSVWDEMRIELTMGQYLDVLGSASGTADLETARRIAVYKSGRYTVTRPLHLGAAVAGRLDDLEGHYTAFGEPLGEAFQLRDDLLGVFGEPEVTGKPVGDDLREGKPTLLVALARERANLARRKVLDRIGDPDLTDAGVDRIRAAIDDTGARLAVERRIELGLEQALDALATAPVPPHVAQALRDLARSATERSS